MRGAHQVVLAVALGAPLVAVAVALAVVRRGRVGPPPVAAVGVAATVAAVAWASLVAAGAAGRAGPFHLSSLEAAAGCGAALTVAAVGSRLARPRAAVGAGLALAAVGIALTGGAHLSAWAVAGGLALAAAAAVDATPASERLVPAALAAAALAATLSGFLLLHSRTSRWALPAAAFPPGRPTTGALPRPAAVAFLVAAVLLAVAAGRRADRAPAALMALGLALGLAATSGRAGGEELAGAAVGLGTGAVVAAGTRRGALALALLALAVAAGPLPLAPASRLLAAGAVVALVVDRHWALLAAVPGGVSLAAGVLDDGGRLALAVALAALVVAAVLAWTAADGTGEAQAPDRASVPALVAGAWLVVAPGSWTWTGAALGAYDRGAAWAAAAGLLAAVGSVLVASADGPSAVLRRARWPRSTVNPGRGRARPRPRRPTPHLPVRRRGWAGARRSPHHCVRATQAEGAAGRILVRSRRSCAEPPPSLGTPP